MDRFFALIGAMIVTTIIQTIFGPDYTIVYLAWAVVIIVGVLLLTEGRKDQETQDVVNTIEPAKWYEHLITLNVVVIISLVASSISNKQYIFLLSMLVAAVPWTVSIIRAIVIDFLNSGETDNDLETQTS